VDHILKDVWIGGYECITPGVFCLFCGFHLVCDTTK